MKIGILGSGTVGRSLAQGFQGKGYEVLIGTRDPEKEELKAWKAAGGHIASPSETAQSADVAILATAWSGAKPVIDLAGKDAFSGKLLIDVTNPLEFGQSGPELSVGFSASAGETVQSWLPEARVVKCWNIITAAFMCDGSYEGGRLDMFIAGNDETAKKQVAGFLDEFQWNCHDLGGIDQSRILEPFAMLWIRYGVKNQIWNHAFKMVRK
ncbi:MAG: NADPH-dependent F420 reductase [Leptospiraceae bacterium]|nr:NADPH-dependent F420 reductase [Leptospiraceae bacterium]